MDFFYCILFATGASCHDRRLAWHTHAFGGEFTARDYVQWMNTSSLHTKFPHVQYNWMRILNSFESWIKLLQPEWRALVFTPKNRYSTRHDALYGRLIQSQTPCEACAHSHNCCLMRKKMQLMLNTKIITLLSKALIWPDHIRYAAGTSQSNYQCTSFSISIVCDDTVLWWEILRN